MSRRVYVMGELLYSGQCRALDEEETEAIEALAECGYIIREIAELVRRNEQTVRDYLGRKRIQVHGSKEPKWGCDQPKCTSSCCGDNPARPKYNHHIGPDLNCIHCGVSLERFQSDPKPCIQREPVVARHRKHRVDIEVEVEAMSDGGG